MISDNVYIITIIPSDPPFTPFRPHLLSGRVWNYISASLNLTGHGETVCILYTVLCTVVHWYGTRAASGRFYLTFVNNSRFQVVLVIVK
jgi:hypothetical protein